MKKWIKAITFIMVSTLTLAACNTSKTQTSGASVSGEGYEEATIRLAYNLPQDHHIAKGIEQFAKDVTEKSDGAVKVQVYPAGQLLSDKDMNQSILSGGVEMGVNSSTLWASTVPAMGIFDVPYVFKTYEEAGEALNGEFGNKLRTSMEEKGAKVLLFADYGYAQFANNKRPLKSPSDFEGLKIRSIGDIPSEMIKAYGASPVFMGGGEVYMALQRNTVDGATSGTTAMLQRKYDEVTKYLTINNYAYLEFILAVNQDYWNGLPEKTQTLLSKTAKETEDWIRLQAKAEDELTAKQLKEKGMEVYVVPEEDLPEWKEAAKPAWDAFSKNAGDLGNELLEMVDKE
ncbi:DctP family TRAP transporter solute-binding subunit [Bacillus sp. SD075]|uniref:TRAP transporter substrate-binding protein n=1 Tax=Bacillus sp. SD075 TaxID=2781732 RepID=UPI001A978FF5|nr:DctP family TRAP transporter solute-binding subunit [Bacillus sp. SD075]MBO1000021.1 DctP family TRAP transporter solute-binding subunit [Bacillus sp. SD075]